ncbi:flagellar biosynthesis protein FliQ [Heliorestis acidaminivorans]|uniref:Flagellar biosynthetic protein FliQ n=1 Tax=Heliorestis acidaminivorans TaxID=553427 RepID=A0A6I0EUC9_9FIRM|nr:flagellar biosynthesis protein FliQ [Heliorestis acidaminivorans]KAB2954385.1 flagellar biosynthesis protein FliQ [Heliorestis acidaminivorans]
MPQDIVIQLARDALTAVLIIGTPVLAGSLLIGLAVSLFQATTQIQEATLAFVPKIIGVFLIIFILGPWLLENMLQYTGSLFENLHLYTFIR